MSQNEAMTNDEISLRQVILNIKIWWKFILSRWLVILIMCIIGAAVGLLYAYSQDPVYAAETTFVLEEDKGGSGMLGQLGGLANLAGIDPSGGGGGLFQGDNIIQLYKSRTMIQKTLLTEVEYNGKNRLLIDHYIEFNNLGEGWDRVELKNIQFSLKDGETFNRLHDSILGEVVKSISSENLIVNKPDKKLSIIKVEVNAKDEFFAKAFNDQIVQNVNDFYIQTKTKKALENLEILQHQTDSVRNVLNGAIYQTAVVADATPNLNPARQVLIAPAQRSQFNAEANKIILSELVKNLELAKLSLRRETPLIQVIDIPIFPLSNDRLNISKGMILGTVLLGFLTVILLSFKLFFKNIIGE